MRSFTLFAIVCALFARWGDAYASNPDRLIRLQYEPGPKNESCPDAQTLRASVASLLGYEAFDDRAPRSIEVRIVRKDDLLEAELKLRGADGEIEGERTLTEAAGACAELGRTIALAIGLAIDPLFLTRGSKTSTVATKVLEKPPEPTPAITKEEPSTPISKTALIGIGGAANDRPLNATDFLLALTGLACLALGAHIEKGRNRL